ncbi:MAG: amidase [Alphaproteobacteria bacterium]|nr:amidase [Alphaproteobacteria bacterium]
MNDLIYLTAAEAAAAIATRRLTSEALVRACLHRIEQNEPSIHAWAHLDPERSIAEARARDATVSIGPLHGVPVGIKDIINTKDFPTEHNSLAYLRHRPGEDAAIVGALRTAGAVILGKTETVEFASVGRKPPTRNPRNLAHTPGGSSSGSAAAVADFMVPLAIGTQTGGSTIRPAAFCGISGMKPSFGLVNWTGVKHYSMSFDTLGWMGRSVADLALVATALGLGEAPSTAPALRDLKIGFYRSPHWMEADSACREALENAAARLRAAGVTVADIDLGPDFDQLTEAQNIIMHGEGRFAFLPEYRASYHLLHQETRDEVENSRRVTLDQMRGAYNQIERCRLAADAQLATVDALLTPAVPGEAPEGLESNGLATFNRMWTALHVPCITLPGFVGERGLPIGVQLVGRRLADWRLLAVATVVAPLFDLRTI